MAPIVKNCQIQVAKGEIPIEKNVIVTDEFNNCLGYTYRKRASGLVKTGRAMWTDNNKIRLIEGEDGLTCPTIFNLEEKNMNTISFHAKEWRMAESYETDLAERCFIDCALGKMTEVYTIGNWDDQLVEIVSPEYHLNKNENYTFRFWLNGGENAFHDEICQLQIFYDADPQTKDTFKLNRNYLSPVKRYKGWLLFEIPFSTMSNEITQLKFISRKAYTTIAFAAAPDSYEELIDDFSESDYKKSPRHNVFYDNGWLGRDFTDGIKKGAEAFSSSMSGVGKTINDIGKDLGELGKKFGEKNQHFFDKLSRHFEKKAEEYRTKYSDDSSDLDEDENPTKDPDDTEEKDSNSLDA